MYCPHCGKQLPDGARFCTACGAPQTQPAPEQPAYQAQPDWQPAHTPPPAPAPVKKSRTGLIVTVVVVIAAAALGRFVIAPSMLRAGTGTGPGNLTKPSQENTPAVAAETVPSDAPAPSHAADSGYAERETNDAYYQALAVTGYQPVTSPADLAAGLSDPAVELFVRDNGDGSIECHDYAAEGDTVVKYNETVLLDLTGVPAEQKDQIIGSLTAQLSVLDALDFVSADYGESSDGTTGILAVDCTGLDREENWRTLCDMGIFSEDGPYSLTAIKQAEQASGFISLYK